MNFIRHCWNDFAVVIIVVVGFNWCFAFSLLLGELAFAVDSGLIFVLVVFPPPPSLSLQLLGEGPGALAASWNTWPSSYLVLLSQVGDGCEI